MIDIRAAQVKAVFAPLREYEQHALELIAREYPAELEARGEEGCRELVSRAWAKARRYGLERRPELTGLLTLMLVFGEDFDTEVPSRRQLLEGPLAPEDKIDALLEAMIAEQERAP